MTFMEVGARAVISLDMWSAMPEYMVVPRPERTTLAYRSLRMSARCARHRHPPLAHLTVFSEGVMWLAKR